MPYAPGDTLLVKDPNPWDDRRHLFIVVTDPTIHPEGLLLMPCLESRTPHTRDLSCRLQPGDHPFVRHESVVNYRDAVVIGPAGLDALIASGHAKRKEPLRPEVLARVVEGAHASPTLDPEKRALLPPRPQASNP